MSGLLLLVRSAAAARARVAGVVEGAAGVVVGAVVEAVAAVEVVAAVGVVEGVGALVVAVEAAVGVAVVAAVAVVAVGLELRVEVLEEARGSGSSVGARPLRPSSFVSGCYSVGRLGHRCISHLDDAWRAEFGDEVERPHWAELLRSGVAIFDLDYDAILFAMYALSASAEGDCYRCVPPHPSIEAAAQGVSECVLPGLHLPSFSTNLVSTAALQDAMVTTTPPGGQRVSICTCTRTGRHLATFTCRPGWSLYTLAIEPPQVAASAQVSVSGHVAPPCSCRLLSHQTLLWHHRLGHPSLPCLCGMHSHLLVSGHPRSLPPLPPSPAPPCLRCVEGRQRTAPHSSSFPPTIAPLQTLHMDVWGPARVSGEVRERYFWLSVSSSASGFVRTFLSCVCTLTEVVNYPLTSCTTFVVGRAFFSRSHSRTPLRKNGIAERRIGLVMEVACTSMIHAGAPHFLWPFAVLYAFYHPTSRRIFPSQDFTFDESVPVYRLFPYRSAPPPPPPLFLTLGPPLVDPLPPQGVAQGVASGGAASWGAEPVVAESEGVEPGGAESEGAESGGAEPQGAALPRGPAGASPRLSLQQLREWLVRCARLRSGATGAGGAGATAAGGAGVTARDGGTGGTAATRPGGARTGGTGAAETGGVGDAGAGDPKEPGAGGSRGPGACGAAAGGAGVGGTGAGGAGAGGTDARGAGAVDPGGTVRPRPYFVPLLQQVLGVPSSTSLTPPLLCPPHDQSQLPLQPASPLTAPSPYTEQSSGLIDHRKPASHRVSPLRTARRVPHSRPPPVLGTHAMALRPSSVPLRVPQPAPPESSLPEDPDPVSDRARAASPTVSRLLATIVSDPSFESAVASALVAELLDFAAACRLDYATALIVEFASASPPSVGGECALGTDVLEDRQEDFECLATAVPRFASMLLAPEGDPDAPGISTPCSYAEAITGPYSSQWQAAMDAEMASWNQRQGVDYFQTFSPTLKMTTLRVLLHVVAQRDYELHSLDISTAFLTGQPARGDLAAPPPTWLHWVVSCSTSGMGLVLGGRGPVVFTSHADTSWVDDSATQWSSQGYTFSLGSGSVSWRSTRSSSVLNCSCEAEIYAGAMAAQELRWLTYLVTDLGEQPCSPPVLYVDNKAMIALCQEHRLEHRTKHIAL
ncbi:unnamed protein product [Closterium sp. NIES-54]